MRITAVIVATLAALIDAFFRLPFAKLPFPVVGPSVMLILLLRRCEAESFSFALWYGFVYDIYVVELPFGIYLVSFAALWALFRAWTRLFSGAAVQSLCLLG